MAVNFASAVNAYANANRMISGAGAEPVGGQSFGKLMQQAAANFVGTLDKGEKSSMQAVTGKADLTAVTEAVTNAEVALQTVVAVRDRVIAAYQDILKMPI